MNHLDFEVIGGVVAILAALIRLESRLSTLETAMKIVLKRLKLD